VCLRLSGELFCEMGGIRWAQAVGGNAGHEAATTSSAASRPPGAPVAFLPQSRRREGLQARIRLESLPGGGKSLKFASLRLFTTPPSPPLFQYGGALLMLRAVHGGPIRA
jgi:hypothetical protein